MKRRTPYPNPYSPCLGAPEQLRAWIVPAHLLQDGSKRSRSL